MKILQINKFYFEKGGSERYMFLLEELLEEKGNKNISFSMQSPYNNYSKYAKYFVENRDYSKTKLSFDHFSNSLYSSEAKRKLEDLIKNEKPDIAHLHNITHYISPSIIHVLKKYNISIVQTLHDFSLITPYSHLYIKDKKEKIKNSFLADKFGKFEFKLHKFLKIYNDVDFFICPSKFIQSKLIENGIKKEKLVYISNFINCDEIEPRYKVGSYVLYFGRISEEKDIFKLVKVFEKLKDIYLVMAGDGDMKETIENYIKEKELKNIKLVGFRRGEELENLIKNSAFTIFTSKVYENLPYSILESMSYGKPVLAPNIGGISEIIEDEKTGYLFDPGNLDSLDTKVKNIFENKDRIKEIGVQARKKIEKNYNKEIHYEKLMDVYKKAFEKSKSLTK